MDTLLQDAYQALPIDILRIVASKAIQNAIQNSRFNKIKNEAPEALTSVFKEETGWEGILEADFDDLIVRIVSNDDNYPGQISRILVYAKAGNSDACFYPQRNLVGYNRPSKRIVAMLAILIHRFLPTIQPSTIEVMGRHPLSGLLWCNRLRIMF